MAKISQWKINQLLGNVGFEQRQDIYKTWQLPEDLSQALEKGIISNERLNLIGPDHSVLSQGFYRLMKTQGRKKHYPHAWYLTYTKRRTSQTFYLLPKDRVGLICDIQFAAGYRKGRSLVETHLSFNPLKDSLQVEITPAGYDIIAQADNPYKLVLTKEQIVYIYTSTGELILCCDHASSWDTPGKMFKALGREDALKMILVKLCAQQVARHKPSSPPTKLLEGFENVEIRYA